MKPKVTVRLLEQQIFFGPGIAELMEHIIQCGSIKNAAQQMGLSYTKALRILNQAETELNFPLLQRFHGGSSGGKAILTPEGENFLSAYHRYNQEVQQFAEKEFDNFFPGKKEQ